MARIGRCILPTPVHMIGIGPEIQQGSDGFCAVRTATSQEKRTAPHRIDCIHLEPRAHNGAQGRRSPTIISLRFGPRASRRRSRRENTRQRPWNETATIVPIKLGVGSCSRTGQNSETGYQQPTLPLE